jgi:DNA-binding response OmpR family regulator
MVIGTDMHFCYLMGRYVRASDHPILIANLEEEALDLAQREKPALIVLEAGQPGTQSLHMLKSLKSNSATCQIPIVFCSWHDEDLSGRETGADVCLHMPVLYSDFLAVLGSLGI